MQRLIVRIVCFLIRLYQMFSRCLLSTTCRYHPSCSEYTLQAVAKFGFFHGLKMAAGRIARCSPFFKGGYDPVGEADSASSQPG
ncbi:MAG: membrane protein insertion efficiency factor YidD [Candidatus Omnitrophica bacterium CG12_big_fil_rev_8_21_14_0_65_50_5]|nr:MAG: membrane protein insertion efficiency factor YidD [Candidatus Omnitrophica bacterium CG12_big_fil_rev_8_21_14_0_65_50_5]